jgi:hypothetical protein
MNRPPSCGPRFKVERNSNSIAIIDDWLGLEVMTSRDWLLNDHLQFFNWYWKAVMRQLVEIEQMKPRSSEPVWLWDSPSQLFEPEDSGSNELSIAAVSHIREGESTHLQRNAASTRDFARIVPKPLVVVVKVNGHPARALFDSGSLGDFISSTLVDQLKLKRESLTKPIPLHLAVQGSRSMINYGTTVQLEYQTVNETRYFDVANLHNYDLILGTPFMYQHEVLIGLNESRVVIGLAESKPINGLNTSKLSSRAMDLVNDDLDKVRMHLLDYAESAGLFADPSRSPLPPLRDINHSIDLIDENLIIPWRPARIAEALRSQWVEKKDLYLKSGRWRISNSRNTVPLLCIPKPNKPKDKPEL